jgi:hypothetical protein
VQLGYDLVVPHLALDLRYDLSQVVFEFGLLIHQFNPYAAAVVVN